jgi:hypothetical protein
MRTIGLLWLGLMIGGDVGGVPESAPRQVRHLEFARCQLSAQSGCAVSEKSTLLMKASVSAPCSQPWRMIDAPLFCRRNPALCAVVNIRNVRDNWRVHPRWFGRRSHFHVAALSGVTE